MDKMKELDFMNEQNSIASTDDIQEIVDSFIYCRLNGIPLLDSYVRASMRMRNASVQIHENFVAECQESDSLQMQTRELVHYILFVSVAPLVGRSARMDEKIKSLLYDSKIWFDSTEHDNCQPTISWLRHQFQQSDSYHALVGEIKKLKVGDEIDLRNFPTEMKGQFYRLYAMLIACTFTNSDEGCQAIAQVITAMKKSGEQFELADAQSPGRGRLIDEIDTILIKPEWRPINPEAQSIDTSQSSQRISVFNEQRRQQRREVTKDILDDAVEALFYANQKDIPILQSMRELKDCLTQAKTPVIHAYLSELASDDEGIVKRMLCHLCLYPDQPSSSANVLLKRMKSLVNGQENWPASFGVKTSDSSKSLRRILQDEECTKQRRYQRMLRVTNTAIMSQKEREGEYSTKKRALKAYGRKPLTMANYHRVGNLLAVLSNRDQDDSLATMRTVFSNHNSAQKYQEIHDQDQKAKVRFRREKKTTKGSRRGRGPK